MDSKQRQILTIEKLVFTNFRNLHGSFNASNGFNILLGANGSGKTNFLDSIHYLATGKTFRVNLVDSNINWADKDASFSSVEVVVSGVDKKYTFKAVFSENTIKYFRDSANTTRNKISEKLKVVVFHPQNMNLFTGDPQSRRDDLDTFISQLFPGYNSKLLEYSKLLRQKNALLRQISENRASSSQLKFWNEKLSNLGAELIHHRYELINNINRRIDAGLDSILDRFLIGDMPKIQYESKFPFDSSVDEIERAIDEKYTNNMDKEIIVGHTLYGPHRDDYSFEISGKNSRNFVSRGQQRMLTIALRLAMWQELREKSGISPIIILDDVMSELDSGHRSKLLEILKQFETQIFISSAEPKYFDDQFLKEVNVIRLG